MTKLTFSSVFSLWLPEQFESIYIAYVWKMLDEVLCLLHYDVGTV